ncbi:MAG: ParA family protein [Mangrovibacterium sp.]
MVIVFGNQKGGAGKSTLAMLFANYLTLVKKQKAIILDMDYQRSILSRFEESRSLENPEPYEVIDVELAEFPAILDLLKEHKEQTVIIDLPGKIDDDALVPVIQAADLFAIPFAYDKFTYQSTVIFTLIAVQLNPGAKKVFIPNRLKPSVNYSLMKEINQDFSQYGKVTSALTDRVAFQRLTTKDIPPDLLPMIEPVFEMLQL